MNLSELAGWGRIAKEIEPLKDLKLRVHSLTVKEEEEIYTVIAKVSDDALVKTSALQIETLARSIETINGEKFLDVEVLRNHLKSLQRHLLNVIWQSWVKEIEEPAINSINDSKKNSEPPMPG